MGNSKLFSVLITILIVLISYVFYNPGNLFNFLHINDKLKNILVLLNLQQSSTLNNDSINEFYTSTSEGLFTESELRRFTGENNDKIYISILGKVFDVTKGRKYYGVGQSYHGFAGRDASKAFITGDFTKDGLIDDISELSLNELGDLQEWKRKYERDYIYKGKLIGRFYDTTGKPTKFLKEIEAKLSHLAANQKMEEFYQINYPPCNAEWTPETGSRVWCSRLSGGIKRDWIGFPRKFHQPGSGVSRCACVNLNNEKYKKGSFEIYENCASNAISCYLPKSK